MTFVGCDHEAHNVGTGHNHLHAMLVTRRASKPAMALRCCTSRGCQAPHLLMNPLLLRLLNAFDRKVLNGLLFPALVDNRMHALSNGLVDAADQELQIRHQLWVMHVSASASITGPLERTGNCSWLNSCDASAAGCPVDGPARFEHAAFSLLVWLSRTRRQKELIADTT